MTSRSPIRGREMSWQVASARCVITWSRSATWVRPASGNRSATRLCRRSAVLGVDHSTAERLEEPLYAFAIAWSVDELDVVQHAAGLGSCSHHHTSAGAPSVLARKRAAADARSRSG